jgi:hypothetical protein
MESRHVSIEIDRPEAEVYAYVSNPANLPHWAAGLTGSIEQVDGEWVANSPLGSITVEFAPQNGFGVLDHVVTTQDGQSFYNPVRVIGFEQRSEVVFTVRRFEGLSDEQYEADVAAVAKDLATLKKLLETA